MRVGNTISEKRSDYISGIGGLRAVAVLMVVFYHMKMPFARGGLLGVTVFFVISGFLITRILKAELESTNTVALGNFWRKRIRRLLPAVLAMLPALIFATALWDRALFTKACQDLPSALFGYNNWHQIFSQVSYFENAGAPSPLTHFWSLAIEMQFYLIYPLLLMFLSRFANGKKASVWVTLALAILSAGMMGALFDPAKDPSRVYYGTDTRAFSLLFGSLLALADGARDVAKKIPDALRKAIGLAAFFGLLVMMATANGYSIFLYRGGQALASLLALVVIFAILDGNGALDRALGCYPLQWIGERSYGIYLWHYPIILLISDGKRSAWWMALAELLLTGILSALSYHYIEMPVRRGAIGQNIEVMKSHPETEWEQSKRMRVIGRNVKVIVATLAVMAGAALCVAFVPRETVLDDIDAKKKQAADADKLASQKVAKVEEEEPVSDTGEEEMPTEETLADVKDERTEEEILSSLNLLLIGDSISLGMTDAFYGTFPNSISDAAVSRQTYEGIDIYAYYVQNNGWNGDGVIFCLGSNGPFYNSLSILREMMGPDKPLFLTTVRAPYVEWEDSNNEEVSRFVEETDNTYLIDWYKASEGHPEWMEQDDTHLVPEGANAYMDCIKQAVLEVFGKNSAKAAKEGKEAGKKAGKE